MGFRRLTVVIALLATVLFSASSASAGKGDRSLGPAYGDMTSSIALMLASPHPSRACQPLPVRLSAASPYRGQRYPLFGIGIIV
jgi:hypothetical protein